jgi:hypothetical protein
MKGIKIPFFLATYLNREWKFGNYLRFFSKFELLHSFQRKKQMIEFVRKKFQNFAALHKKRLTPMPFI